MAANTKTKMGVLSINMEALMGEVIDKPLKNNSIFPATPNTAETNSGHKSLLSLIHRLCNNQGFPVSSCLSQLRQHHLNLSSAIHHSLKLGDYDLQ
jgi:hypothetical protein